MCKSTLLYAFLGGALVGGALGVLYAPKSGKETREYIRRLVRRKCRHCSESDIDAIVEELTAELNM